MVSAAPPFENLHREMKQTLPNNMLFDGGSLDLASVINPNFQITHSLKYASAGNPPSYSLGVLHSTPRAFLHANMDHDANLNARAYFQWKEQDKDYTPASLNPTVGDKTKFEAQVPSGGQQAVLSIEHEQVKESYAFNLRAINPNPFDKRPSYDPSSSRSTTGIFSLSFMQRIMSGLYVGGEYSYQKPMPDMDESSVTLGARYTPTPTPLPSPPAFPSGMQSPFPPVSPMDPTQVYSVSYSPSSGLLHASYWHRINPRLELATELQSLITPGTTGQPGRREGIATVGFRLQTVFANIRAQIDSHAKIASVVEYAIAPGLHFSVSNEMDYATGKGGQGKIGLGFAMEA